MGPETRDAAVEIPLEPLLERGRRRRLALVAQDGLREPELAGPLREGRTEEPQGLAARGDDALRCETAAP